MFENCKKVQSSADARWVSHRRRPTGRTDTAVQAHGFDFESTRTALRLDFYGCVRLVNFVRSQVW